MSLLKYAMYEAIANVAIMKTQNEKLIQESIDLYWKACEYPRKKKKAVRKKALSNYSLWKRIESWEKETFGF